MIMLLVSDSLRAFPRDSHCSVLISEDSLRALERTCLGIAIYGKMQDKDFWCALLKDKLDLKGWGTSRRI